MVYKQNATVTTVYSLLNSTGDENCDRYLSLCHTVYLYTAQATSWHSTKFSDDYSAATKVLARQVMETKKMQFNYQHHL